MSDLRAALVAAYDADPAAAVAEVASTLTDLGCPVLLVALTGSDRPVVLNSINIDHAGIAVAEQVVGAALRAVGVPGTQAQGWARIAAPIAVQKAREYAALRAARARAAGARR